MKFIALIAATTLAIVLVACGGGSSTTTTTDPANGAWSEMLTSASNQQLGSFTFDMTQNSTTLAGSSMNSRTWVPCCLSASVLEP